MACENITIVIEEVIDNISITIQQTVESVTVVINDFSISNIVSDDIGNQLGFGSDGLLYVPESTGVENHSELNLDDGTNPHGTTKSDVGLSDVPNLNTTDAVNNQHTHSNKSVLDSITEAFTTSLKTAYDSAVIWISTNGANLINHLSNTSNPHSVTKTQVGLGNVINTDTTTTSNILDSTDKRFVTDAEKTKLSNTSGTNTGDETTTSIQSKRPLKTIEGNSIEGTGNISLKKKQTFSLIRDWSTATLDRAYYISFNSGANEFRPVGTNNTIIDTLTGRNQGMFQAPYNCKITKVIFSSRNTGSFTGTFGVASGSFVDNALLASDYSNRIVHLSQSISSSGFVMKNLEFPIVGGTTITKGDVVCPVLMFSAQAQATKNGVTIQIEIEEV